MTTAAATTATVHRLAARAGATPTETRRVLASLGLIHAPDAFIPLPTTCGHPSSDLYRRTSSTGFGCRACERTRP